MSTTRAAHASDVARQHCRDAELDASVGGLARGWHTNHPGAVTWRRLLNFNRCGVLGYTSARGPTGGNLHPDRCECQGSDTTPHKHYAGKNDEPYSCARCSECDAYRPAVKAEDVFRLPSSRVQL